MPGMRWIWFAAVLLIVPIFTVTSGEAGEDEPMPLSQISRDIEIPYTESPPVLDGNLGSAEWKTYLTGWYFDGQDGMSFAENYSDPVNGFDEELGDQEDISAIFYAQYDDEFLYIAANVTDDNIVVDTYPADPSWFYRDDGLEILIDGAHDKDIDQRAGDPWPGWEDGTTVCILADNSYHHDYSAANGYPLGRKFGIDEAWYGISRAVVEEHYYVVEMRIRLENISSPLPNSTIGLNIGINDDDTGALSKTAVKWAGGNFTPAVNDIFKNETKWGSAKLATYVKARIDKKTYVDEDTPLVLSGGESEGNHPDFSTSANYTWVMPVISGGNWSNVTRYGMTTEWFFPDPASQIAIHLTVTDPSGISDTASTIVFVNDTTPPTINAADASALEEEPFVYTLNASDNGVISGYNWSLFDGGWFNISTDLPTFTHTFHHPGIYSVHVRVIDSFNNSNEGDFSVIVNDTKPPVIVFDRNTIVVDSGEQFYLDAGESSDDNPSSQEDWWLNFTWRFVLGPQKIERFGPNVSMVLDVPGLYSCNLTVADFLGHSSYRYFNISVRDILEPVVDFNLPGEIKEGTSINLTGIFCSDDDPTFPLNATFIWNVTIKRGDLSHSREYQGIEVEVFFPIAGDCVVNLTVLDAAGNPGYAGKKANITDNTPPEAVIRLPDIVDEDTEYFLDFNGSSDNIAVVRVHFLILDMTREREYRSSPAGGIYIENIPPSSYSSMDDFLITFVDPGEYAVILTVFDGMGLSSNVSRMVTVRDVTPPAAVINKTYVVLFIGEPLFLNGGGSMDNYGPLHYHWIIQETQESFPGMDLQIFLDEGEYNITLRVTDDGGNSDEAYCTVIVKDTGSGGGIDTGRLVSFILWVFVFLFLVVLMVMAVIVARRSMTRVSPGRELALEAEYHEE
ncbi:MAG: PKD domain-containing protein [Thermoplasmatota archaeon]